jgi:hypothetical protein
MQKVFQADGACGAPEKMIAYFTKDRFDQIMEECRVRHLRKMRYNNQRANEFFRCECGCAPIRLPGKKYHLQSKLHERRMMEIATGDDLTQIICSIP